MEISVELYPDAKLPRSHVMPIAELIRPAVKQLVGFSLPGMRFLLSLAPVPEDFNPKAPVVNMAADYGYAILYVFDRQMHLHYRHPHPLSELLAEPLARRLRLDYPQQERWGYRLVGKDLNLPMSLPTPPVEGLNLGRSDQGERARFSIRRLEEEPPPLSSFTELGLDLPGANSAPLTVFLPESLHQQLLYTMPLSHEVEEGGFLVGRLFADRHNPERYLVQLTSAPKAEHTGASLLHFTFTGDSFAAVKRQLPQDRSARRLLGWYHTHLFPAREQMGLSSIDLDLHFSTFRQPWQLAGLINLEQQRRILRFYMRQGQTMLLCPYHVVPRSQADEEGPWNC